MKNNSKQKAALLGFGFLAIGVSVALAQIDFSRIKKETAFSDKKSVEDNKIQARLLADRSAIVPGRPFEVALTMELQEGWHTYWRNRGEGGLEPSFKWHLPEGFQVSTFQYPPPKRHVDEAGDHTFILEGAPILLAKITPPESLKTGSKVTLAVSAQWLVCKSLCSVEKKELSIELPVVYDEQQIKPIHPEVFERARAALPVPMSKAKHLKKLWAAADTDKIEPEKKLRVAVVLDIPDHFHINSNKPLSEGLIATDLFHDSTEGLKMDRPIFPKGKVRKMEDEELSIYSGRAVIILPIEPDKALEAKSLRVSGVVTYQTCDEKSGVCFPPTAAEWELTLPVAGADEPVTKAYPELFQMADSQSGTTLPAPPGIAAQDKSPRSWLQRFQDRMTGLGVFGFLLMAFIGGFIMNLMPCVLPVISIKILSFVQQAGESRLRIFTLGLVFGAGILVSFAVLGILIVGLGQQWGGQFQYPQVVIGLAAIVTAFALSLFGVFTVNPPQVVSALGGKVQGEGYLSVFGMGLLATWLGTACVAPFISAVVAIAVKQPAIIGLLIFMVAGVGMAFPYILLAAQPAWIRVIPRPGPWMTTFEHIIGFCLLGTVVWLLNPLVSQIGGEGLEWTLVFLLFVAVAAWLYGRVEFGAPAARKWRYYIAAAVIVAGGWILCFRVITSIPELAAAERERQMGASGHQVGQLDWSGREIPWVRYTRRRAMETVLAGKTIFIDYTAEWCPNCKANEKLVLNTPEVRQSMRELGIVPFKADFTSYDPDIKADLARHGRAGVPMYLILPPGRPDDAILLDEILTKAAVIDNLKRAATMEKKK